MGSPKQIEAQITTAAGATIHLKGDKNAIAEVLSRFAAGEPVTKTGAPPPKAGSLAGVAEKDEEGNVNIVAGDLKAHSAGDAATRLIYTTLLARRELLKEKKTPRHIINRVLKNYGVYDGNTRNIIPRERALIKEGKKFVTLSSAAVPKAWGYVTDMQDETQTGKWTPSRVRRRKKKHAAKKKP